MAYPDLLRLEGWKHQQTTRKFLKARTATRAVARQESGGYHSNLGASGSVAFTLPQTAAVGEYHTFMVVAAQALSVDPGAAGAIYIGGAKQSDDAAVSSSTIGDCITLVADGKGDWYVAAINGTWGFAQTIADNITLSGNLSVAGDLDLSDGGTVTQITNDSTAVELNTHSGEIITVALTLAAGADTSFTLTNSKIGANDFVGVCGKIYAGTADGIISAQVEEVAAGSCVINIQNIGAAQLDSLARLTFVVIGGAVT